MTKKFIIVKKTVALSVFSLLILNLCYSGDSTIVRNITRACTLYYFIDTDLSFARKSDKPVSCAINHSQLFRKGTAFSILTDHLMHIQYLVCIYLTVLLNS